MTGADDVQSPFIRARYAWEASDTDEAVRILHTIIAGAEGGPGFWVSPRMVKALAPGGFENFVVSLTMDDDILVPLDAALGRLWHAMPGQYVVLAIEVRQTRAAEVSEEVLDIVYRAAADGLVSNLMVDFGDVGWVVLRAPDHPHLAEILDWGKLDTRLRVARVRGARAAFVRAHRAGLQSAAVQGLLSHGGHLSGVGDRQSDPMR